MRDWITLLWYGKTARFATIRDDKYWVAICFFGWSELSLLSQVVGRTAVSAVQTVGVGVEFTNIFCSLTEYLFIQKLITKQTTSASNPGLHSRPYYRTLQLSWYQGESLLISNTLFVGVTIMHHPMSKNRKHSSLSKMVMSDQIQRVVLRCSWAVDAIPQFARSEIPVVAIGVIPYHANPNKIHCPQFS